jgi:uncharacterized protein YbjT (DUF2867 family)
MRIAVLGASGYVGTRLVPHLVHAGHDVVALGRRESALPEGERVERRVVDVEDQDALRAALEGCEAAYYLVHSMAGGEGFEARDLELAKKAAAAAADAGLSRLVYLGGLGEGDLSPHLASRHEVGEALRSSGLDVVELRAAVVLGSGSISFEMLRYLTERLPVMICPRWIATKVQPIAEQDLLAFLEQSLTVAPDTYEIGGPEVTSYRGMIAAYAEARGLPRRRIIDVPVLTPGLSAHWVDLVTPVDSKVSHSLIESLTSEVVVHDHERTAAAFTVEPLGVADAIRAALDAQLDAVPAALFAMDAGVHDGIYVMRAHADVQPEHLAGAQADLASCGGDLRWYGWAWAWRARLLLGRAFGEHLEVRRPAKVEVGATVDWWTVERFEPDRLVLGTTRWFCGEAWLGYAVLDEPTPHVLQVGALRTLGLRGLVYWRLIWPVHLIVFQVMAKRQAVRAVEQTKRSLRSVVRARLRRPRRGHA